jgi:hypothetical protein
MQFDATYLSPTLALPANGTFGGLTPAMQGPPKSPYKEHRDDPYDLEAFAAASQDASSTAVVAKSVHGIVPVSLDPNQAPIPVAHCVSANGSVPADNVRECS